MRGCMPGRFRFPACDPRVTASSADPRSELAASIRAFLAFFFLLAAYFVLRPVRDQLGGAVGAVALPWFYAATFATTLVLTPVFGGLAARLPRRRLLAWTYGFFVICLLAFAPAFAAQARIGAFALGVVFFVWVSVFNLFVVSLFWSFMADVFVSVSARRLFPRIALGGTAGALAGPLLTSLLVGVIGVAPLLVVSAGLLLLALALMLCIGRGTGVRPAGGQPLGGSLWAGLRQVFSEPFLRRMALLMLLGDGVGTVAYALVADYAKAHLVGAAVRTAFYAHMDLATNLLVVLLQSGVSSRLLARRQGLTWGLVLPALVNVTVLGAIAALGAVALRLPWLELTDGLRLIWVGVPLLALLQILTRGFTYGMLTPAINALYTRVTREARYKGKNFIETTVWRFGDVAVTTTLDALRGLGVGIAGLALLSGTGAAVAARIGYRVARSRDLAPEIPPPERRAQPTI